MRASGEEGESLVVELSRECIKGGSHWLSTFIGSA